ncbi:MAG: substrate-binding domain-containing protein [Lentisphaeria bacterium]|nr:substrate-binding domain-containing protein [Lentisphaeria bacterium]
MAYKFEEILQQLQRELQAGKYPVGSRFPSANELALRFNINRTTANKISLVLLNNGILRRTGSTRAGLTVADPASAEPVIKIALIGSITHSFFAKIASGFFAAAAKNNVLVMPFNPEFKQLDSLLRKLENSGFKGIGTYSFGKLDTTLPVIYLEPEELDPPLPSVAGDTRQGGHKIIEAIKNAGHKEIAFCFADVFSDPRSARIQGMTEAALQAGWHDVEKRIFWYHRGGNSALRVLREMITAYPGLTAIATDSDDRVFQLIRAGKQLGVPIPEKITPFGFGNVEQIHHIFHFPTIEQHPFDVGVCGCETLLELIRSGNSASEKSIKIDVELLNV